MTSTAAPEVCPRCNRKIPTHSFGYTHRPGELHDCHNCGLILAVNLDLSHRAATDDEIATEKRLNAGFEMTLKRALVAHRMFVARRAGMSSAADLIDEAATERARRRQSR
jgi:hypothetical protein